MYLCDAFFIALCAFRYSSGSLSSFYLLFVTLLSLCFFDLYTVPTTARAIYGENTCNFGENPRFTKKCVRRRRHTMPFDRVKGDI